jgi:HPt (histidine-containing phosphotransfer) domain-containing protein
MDGYAAKPLRLQELNNQIARFFTVPAATSEQTHHDCPTQVDWTEALRCCDGDRQLVVDVARVFVDELPQQLHTLRHAVETGDRDVARRIAHTIRGAARMFGPTPALQMADQIEQHAAAGELTAARNLLPELQKCSDGLLAEVCAVVQGTAPLATHLP